MEKIEKIEKVEKVEKVGKAEDQPIAARVTTTKKVEKTENPPTARITTTQKVEKIENPPTSRVATTHKVETSENPRVTTTHKVETSENPPIPRVTTAPKVDKTEIPPTTRVNVSEQQRKSTPIIPWSSYKSVIIVLCAAILCWMLLQVGNKQQIKDLFHKRHEPTTTEKIQSTIGNTKDSILNSYEKAAESTKTTLHNVADKVKSMYGEKINTMRESSEQNKEYLKEKVSGVAEDVKQTTKGTMESLKGKSQETLESLKEKSQETLDSLKGKSQETLDSLKGRSQETLDSLKGRSQETLDSLKGKSQDTIESLKDKTHEAFDTVKTNSQGAYDTVKTTSQGAYDTIKTTSQGVLDSIKTTSQETVDKAKEKLVETQNFFHGLNMVGLIEQSYSMLQQFMGPHMSSEDQIPFKAFIGSKAVVFLTVVKGGIGLGGAYGTGIIIVRNDIGHWSGPCAIALMGVDIGLNIGVEKSDHMIVLYDDTSIKAFSSKGQVKLGIDASIAVGPKGRETSMGFSVGDKGYASMFSYSLVKGAYIGLSFEGQIITVRNDCNEEYYGKKVDASKILDGTIKPPKNKHLTKIYKHIDEYAARNLVYPEHATEL